MVFEQITGMVAGTLDIVLSPLTILQPNISLLIISVFVASLIFGLNKVVVNRKLLKELKVKMEEIRENLTQAQKDGNNENAKKFLDEMMKLNGQYTKHTFKAMIVSIIVVSLFFPWMGYKYGGLTAVAVLPFSLPVIGSSLNWLYWYVLVSFGVGWVLNKLFGGMV